MCWTDVFDSTLLLIFHPLSVTRLCLLWALYTLLWLLKHGLALVRGLITLIILNNNLWSIKTVSRL